MRQRIAKLLPHHGMKFVHNLAPLHTAPNYLLLDDTAAAPITPAVPCQLRRYDAASAVKRQVARCEFDVTSSGLLSLSVAAR